MIGLKRKLSGRVSLVFSLVSALLLSCGWIGAGGFPLVVALVPLLLISANLDASWRSTLKMLGYAALTFVLWNIATVWWIWNATPIGPIAATIFSTWWSLLAFMLYHIVSKRAPNGVASVLLIAAWIAGEYIYMEAPALSFPWLVLGNGFTADTWAVQWYEYTGVLGGSLWVLLLNVLALQSIRTMRKGVWLATTFVFALPLIFSLVLYGLNSPENSSYTSRQKVSISAIQPNVDCYKKFNTDSRWQQDNLVALLQNVPDSVQFVLMPETSLSTLFREGLLTKEPVIERMANALDAHGSDAMIIAGCETMRIYGNVPQTTTARDSGGVYYDIYNSAVGIEVEYDAVPLHRKGRLVVGVETIPAWLRRGGIFEVDLGGTVGQLGIGESARPFVHNDICIAPAICYEAVYGDYIGEFVRNGAQVVGVISNDGWWGNTPGHRYLFAFCRLRAIEHRRDIARSANTGISGFINSRGDEISTMGWDKRGVLTADVRLNNRITFYTKYGDYIGRIALYVALLCLLYTIAYCAKKRFYLVD